MKEQAQAFKEKINDSLHDFVFLSESSARAK